MSCSTLVATVLAMLIVSSGARLAAVRAAPRPDAADGASAPEPNGVVTLRDALAWALARNPQLGVYPYDLRAADALIVQAGLWPNPELGVTVEEFGGRGERRGFEGAETTVELAQPIELGGKRAGRTRVAALDKELVQWDYQAARLDVMRETARAFVTVLAAQERLALSERLLELSRQAQTAVAQRVKAGKDSPVDELRADVAFSETRIEQQNAEKALTAARHTLAATWGSRAPAFEKVEGDFYRTAAPPPLAELTAATANNPDLARWATEEDKRRAALRLERARGVPDIAVGAGVRRFEQTEDAALVFGLIVPVPLFNRNQGGILAATAELEKARRQYEAAQVRILAALSEAVSALGAAYDEVTILHHDVLPKAQRAFEAAQRGYQQGEFDYLYLLDAQRTLFQTQAQYVNSTEAYHKAQADVERLIGRPADTRSSDGRPSHPVPEPSAQVK
jgi:cobalt-zinc-cadmium efflux system outer membrane protein